MVLAITGIIIAAVGAAYSYAATFNQRAQESRDSDAARIAFEDRLTDLINRVQLPVTTDNSSYFIGSQGIPNSVGGQTGLGSLPGGGQGNSVGASSDTLTFMIGGRRIPAALLASTDDFETLNERYGPQGGTTEVGLSMTAVGDAQDKSGLFIREQTPYDGDPSQGGTERIFDDTIKTIKFEFFDGETWQGTWDTRTETQQRLPASIRVTYTLTTDNADTDHTLVLRVPASDVTPTNPITEGATTP